MPKIKLIPLPPGPRRYACVERRLTRKERLKLHIVYLKDALAWEPPTVTHDLKCFSPGDPGYAAAPMVETFSSNQTGEFNKFKLPKLKR